MASICFSTRLNIKSAFKNGKFWNKTDAARSISTLGFIGLGNMGSHMTRNLIKKGFNVVAFDANPDVCRSLREEGVQVSSSLAELSSTVDCVVSMLPDNKTVMDVYSSEEGILSNIKKGALLLDSSTIDPKVPQAIGLLAEKEGVTFFDAPVSGGVMAAENAQLTFMVGGNKDKLIKIEKILLAMGKKIFYCGSYGSGQAAKLCNNMILGISMVGLSEGLNLGVRFGLDPKLLSDVINSSSGRSWASEIYNPVPGILENAPSSRDYKNGFSSRLLTKDLTLAIELAKTTSSNVSLGSKTLEIYKEICKANLRDHDFSIIYKVLNSNGKET